MKAPEWYQNTVNGGEEAVEKLWCEFLDKSTEQSRKIFQRFHLAEDGTYVMFLEEIAQAIGINDLEPAELSGNPADFTGRIKLLLEAIGRVNDQSHIILGVALVPDSKSLIGLKPSEFSNVFYRATKMPRFEQLIS